MHILRPRHVIGVGIEFRTWGSVAHTCVLQEIAAAALAEPVGVVRRRAVGDGFGGSFVEVRQIVGDLFQLVDF